MLRWDNESDRVIEVPDLSIDAICDEWEAAAERRHEQRIARGQGQQSELRRAESGYLRER